jgi:hypothetical protein
VTDTQARLDAHRARVEVAREVDKALNALLLEVAPEIAADVREKVEAMQADLLAELERVTAALREQNDATGLIPSVLAVLKDINARDASGARAAQEDK